MVAVQIEEAKPVGHPGRPHRAAGHVVRAVPSHRDRRHHDPRPPSRPPADLGDDRRPVTVGYAKLASVTDVDPSTPAGGSHGTPALTADDLVRLTGGRLLVRSDRPIRGAAVDSRVVEPGQVFVALPGEHVDGHAFVDQAIARGAAAVLVSRPHRRPVVDRRRDRRSCRGSRWRLSVHWPRAGVFGSIRSSSGSRGASPRRRPRRRSRRSSRRAFGRCATRATSTTRSVFR